MKMNHILNHPKCMNDPRITRRQLSRIFSNKCGRGCGHQICVMVTHLKNKRG
ncbi:hypothetical protein AG1IA_10486 [Rhizoctonia solani AG-1 IA]|uniref:Uncharacterized protein n=1 Tax=Thanatephorus cucumeris (strain AG1-IA) TaxID=983506 RepID=L8WGF8_THACA|nr:hypothetical protein AG1IA_10486 [Rhizoctonia solani AG-1 IA]